MPDSDPGDFDFRHPRLQTRYGIAQPDGIQCPWNRDEHGPAGQRIHCLVWKDWSDFLDNSDTAGEPVFCRTICHHGHMTAEQRSRAFRAHKAWLLLRRQTLGRARWLRGLRLRDRTGRTI